MPTINIDNVEYDTDKLSDEAKAAFGKRGVPARQR